MTTRTAPAAPSSSGTAPSARRARIVVLDDEPAMQRLLKMILEGEGYQVRVTDDGREALAWIGDEGCDLIVQDIRMPKMDGLEFLREAKKLKPETLSIVVTAFGSWEFSVEAMRLGAYTFLAKPFDTEEIRRIVARALERKDIASRSSTSLLPFLDLVGSSPTLNAISALIKRIAPTDSTVLIAGESGTGKELAARAIHYNSLRAQGPFVPVNCGAFPESLLESELFGHVKGAFTNAIADRRGLFESADRGTLFLDEIGEMSLLMQVKLLRVLETRTYKPVGGSHEVRSDVRIIAATNRHLGTMVAEGDFREDLFHRLNVIPIALPPLRERKEDVPLLAGHFLARYSQRMGKSVVSIEDAAMRKLVDYRWPGNVRELENTIERAVALCTGDRIVESDVIGPMSSPAELKKGATAAISGAYQAVAGGAVSAPLPHEPAPRHAKAQPPVPDEGSVPPMPDRGMDLERHLMELERAYIIQALERTDWNLTEAAKLLGMTFRSIRYRVSKLNIERPAR